MFCIMGQNGARKTTLTNLFLGLTDATSGMAIMNDVQVKSGDSTTKKDAAYITEVV